MIENENFLAQLLKCHSVTPNDAGCIEHITAFLNQSPADYSHEDTRNVYYEFGQGDKCFLFVGHTDVVPSGPKDLWDEEPFDYYSNDPVIARGIVDMKGAIWAFCTALNKHLSQLNCKVGILLTSDEEGDGIHGVQHVIPLLQEKGYIANWALVGEPTSVHTVGDYYKHARRGSYTLNIQLHGQQGHSAYPHYAWEPEKALSALLDDIKNFKTKLPKNHDLSLVSIQSSTQTSNIIPATIQLVVNIRYSQPEVIEQFIQLCQQHQCLVEKKPGAQPYESNPKHLKNALVQAIQNVTGIHAKSTNLGGTSDARFLSPIAEEIIEFGLRSEYAHQANEQAYKHELVQLVNIYDKLIKTLCTNP